LKRSSVIIPVVLFSLAFVAAPVLATTANSGNLPPDNSIPAPEPQLNQQDNPSVPGYYDPVANPPAPISGSVTSAPLAPASSASQGSGAPLSKINNVNDLISRISSIGNALIYLLVGLAVVYIVYFTVQYFIKGQKGDESRRAAGMQILWGIVGLAIILSIWGLVNILMQTFGTSSTSLPGKLPQADFVNNH